MTYYYERVSRTFSEYLFIPIITRRDYIPSNVSLKTPVVKLKKGQESSLTINIHLVSATMQSVSDNNLAIALVRDGGLSFIYCSQSIESQ
ncbi:IMP dehydrogenase [Clostridium estertheticum]|nr:IMP dehydrogenase [Clostridium estertheticum]MCB2360154.1 IMP dehydrogenase [Clostridium estertheticum]